MTLESASKACLHVFMRMGKVHMITASVRGMGELVGIHRVKVDNFPRPESKSAETVSGVSAIKRNKA